MGASESTARTNGTRDENEEKNQQESGGNSMGGGTAANVLAAVGVAVVGVAVVVVGISRMISDNTDNQQKDDHHGMESLLVNSRHIEYEGKQQRSIWSPPPPGRFKINTDGGCHFIRGQSYEHAEDVPHDSVQIKPSGYGGILRDHHGNWVHGFRGFIGVTDSFTAELHGIVKGLELLDKLRLNGAILESDCEAAVNWIKERDDNIISKSKIVLNSKHIIMQCRRLVVKNNITIKHILGEDANQCAHKLADLAIDKEDEYVEIEHLSLLPYEIKCLVDKDAKVN